MAERHKWFLNYNAKINDMVGTTVKTAHGVLVAVDQTYDKKHKKTRVTFVKDPSHA